MLSSDDDGLPLFRFTGFTGATSSPSRAAVVGICALSLVAACRREEATPPAPPPTVLTTVVTSRPEPALARRGAASSGARLRLGFNAPGIVAMLAVKTGDAVRKGQTLARLRAGDATASLEAAHAHRSRALRESRSADTLAATGALSTNQRDDARSLLHIANANASLAAEALRQRQLVSPIAGTVLERLAEPGEAVSPGMPVLVLEDTQRLVVEVGVTERELARVVAGQRATLTLDGAGSANDNAGAGAVPATVTSVSPAPGPDGLYAVEVAPDDARGGGAIRPGALVTIRFAEGASAPTVRAPIDALVHRDDKTWVFVIAPGASNTTPNAAPNGTAVARIRELTVGRADGKDVVIRSGLRDGERIVREGGQFLLDGQTVRLLSGGAQ